MIALFILRLKTSLVFCMRGPQWGVVGNWNVYLRNHNKGAVETDTRIKRPLFTNKPEFFHLLLKRAPHKLFIPAAKRRVSFSPHTETTADAFWEGPWYNKLSNTNFLSQWRSTWEPAAADFQKGLSALVLLTCSKTLNPRSCFFQEHRGGFCKVTGGQRWKCKSTCLRYSGESSLAPASYLACIFYCAQPRHNCL